MNSSIHAARRRRLGPEGSFLLSGSLWEMGQLVAVG
jgi:hypothetical protein